MNNLNWKISSFDPKHYEWDIWQKIVDEHHDANPVLHSKFVKLLVEFFSEKIHLAEGSVDGSIKILALIEQPSWGNWSVFKPSQAAIAMIIGQKEYFVNIGELIKKIPNYCFRLNFYSLDPIEHSNITKCIDKNILAVTSTDITIEITKQFDEYWTSRPKSLRKNINRYINRINREIGGISLHVFQEVNDIKDSTNRYGLLESRGWKGSQGTALHPGNKQGKFYRHVMEEFAKQGNATVFELRAGSKILSSRLCVSNGKTLVILKTTFDEETKRYASGRILLFFLLKYIFTEQKISIIDFYTNASSDQLDWSTNSREILSTSIYRNSMCQFLATYFSKIKSLLKILKMTEK